MIAIEDKKDCCGCTTCSQVCPVSVIEMLSDTEGFKYPSVNNDKCIGCRLCEKVCPILNCRPEIIHEQYGYVSQNMDDSMLKKSTSGGTFGALASVVIESGGCVYGAAFEECFKVHHIGISTKDELVLLQKSKYVQSSIELGLFCEIKKLLVAGKIVCFSGTPCQVEGLIHFLQYKEYKNLLTIDIACHSVPSPKVLGKYLELYGGSENICHLDFRNKKYGYDYPTFLIETVDGRKINNGTEIDQYMRAFMDNISVRPSCYNCRFKKLYRESDITIWDCFDIWNFNTTTNNKGANKVLIHSAKGRGWFEKIRDRMCVTEIAVTALLSSSKEITTSCEYNEDRSNFFKDIDALGARELFDKYYPKRAKNYINKYARIFFVKVGMYNFIKKTLVQITKKYE